MYRNVVYDQGLFTALDEMGRKIYIHESISFIYRMAKDEKVVRHIPVKYIDIYYLQNLENFLRGKPCIPDVIDQLTIRYGWLDKSLEKTDFVNIRDFVNKLKDKSATSTDKRKLTAVLKQLSLSRKQIIL